MSTKIVLIVDDEDSIRESLAEIFEVEGFRVLEARDGREALAHLGTAERPDVVILDLVMPVMSGVELFTAMQAEPAWAAIPVIVSTSDPSKAPSGVLLMRKPVNVDRLLDAVRKLC